MKNLFLNSILVCVTLIVIFACLEIAFRFLPVNTGIGTQPVNASTPIMRGQSNLDFVFSIGPGFQLVNKGRVNAQGFVHRDDYVNDPKRLNFAVIGDSYVEALMVPFENTVTGRLHEKVNSKGNVYSFAFSGAPLSQYLIWAEHATQTYGAKGLAIVIIANDFDESLLKYKKSPGFHYLKERDSGYELERVDFAVSSLRQLARKSAFLRYLLINLKITHLADQLSAKNSSGQERIYENNVLRQVSEERLADSKKAVNYFLSQLMPRTKLSSQDIIFVVDGLRPSLYEKDGPDYSSYGAQMFRYFSEQAQAHGFEVIDMNGVFIDDYKVNRTRFEFDVDAHWNDYAHGLVAQEIQESKLFKRLFTQ